MSEATLRLWLAEYDRRGLVMTRKRRRADAGRSRCLTWRALDAAAAEQGLSEAAHRELAARVETEAKQAWLVPNTTLFLVQKTMVRHVREAAAAAGLDLDDEAAEPSPSFLRRKDIIGARSAAILRTDAGRYSNEIDPSHLRHRDGMQPGDCWVVDARHVDLWIDKGRRGGRRHYGTAKQLAILDVATNRIFARTFIFPGRSSITREETFLTYRDAMADSSWGVPRRIYIDNGGEQDLGQSIRDLIAFAERVRADVGQDIAISDDAGECARVLAATALGPGVIKAKAHNARAKPVEGIFSRLHRLESLLPGYAGSDRQVRIVARKGQRPEALTDDPDEMIRATELVVNFYNRLEQRKGTIKGLSPNQAFQRFLDAGWSALTVRPEHLSYAFGDRTTRVLQEGCLMQHGGRFYSAPELSHMDPGVTLEVIIPYDTSLRCITVIDGAGNPVCVAGEKRASGFLDPAGAVASANASRAARSNIRHRYGHLKPHDPLEAMAAIVARSPDPAPNPPAATVLNYDMLAKAARERVGLGGPGAALAKPNSAADALERFISTTERRRHAG